MKKLWNRGVLTAFALSLAGAVPAALAQTVNWTRLRSEEFQFSVSFCGPPTQDPTGTDRKGEITATLNLFKAVTENYMCFVALADYNIKPDVEHELKLNQTNFINAINGTLGTSRRIDFVSGSQKFPALVFTFEMPPDLIGKAIIILKDSRVYMLIFEYHKTRDYTSAVETFMDSFLITYTDDPMALVRASGNLNKVLMDIISGPGAPAPRRARPDKSFLQVCVPPAVVKNQSWANPQTARAKALRDAIRQFISSHSFGETAQFRVTETLDKFSVEEVMTCTGDFIFYSYGANERPASSLPPPSPSIPSHH